MIPIRQYWNLLRHYLRPQRARVAVLAILLLSSIALQVANPQVIKRFIDRAVAGEPGLVGLAALFLIVAISHQAFMVTARWLAEHIGWTATNELRRDLAAHVLDLDMGFHKEHSPGELVERIDGDVTALSNFFSQFSVQVLGNLLLLLGVLVLLTRESAVIGLAMTALAIAAFAGMVRMQQIASAWWRDVRARRAEFYGYLGEVVGATEDIRANGADDFIQRRFTEMHRAWLPWEIKGRWGWSVLWGTNIVYFAVGNAAIFALGSWLFNDGRLSLGSVYLVFFYTEMLRPPLDRIRHQMEDMQKAGAAISRVRELFGRETALVDAGTASLPDGPLAIEFDRVDFTYEDGDDDGRRVLHDITVSVAPGRVIGVLGRTGSGKTTMARLLARLYDPERGTVKVGGVAAPEAKLSSLRRRVGMVTQDVQLFHATIRDNLTFFDDSVTDDRLWQVLEELGLADWVRAKPAGLDTVLQAGGGGLSAGEAQLLAFARIFLEDSGLVVLDEASSRLDPATEQLIERAITRLLNDRTGFIIAHRLETVERADDILILEDGRVIEFGSRRELAADPSSRFARLLRAGIEEVLA